MGNQVEIIYDGVSQGVITETQDIYLNTRNKYCVHDIALSIQLDGGTPTPPATPTDSIIFYAQKPFTLEVEKHAKTWTGTINWSTDNSTWTVWDGTTVLSAVAPSENAMYKLYLKGSSNTTITGIASSNLRIIDRDSDRRWIITNTDTDIVTCKGDFTKVTGAASIDATGALANLFRGNAFLNFDIVLPKLGNSGSICASMFEGCSSMTKAPELHFTNNIGTFACCQTFRSCTSLKTPATFSSDTTGKHTIGSYGCYGMYYGCVAMTTMPEMDFTVGQYGCQYMFTHCINLLSADMSDLATSSTYAFQYMFSECINLTTVTGLPSVPLHSYSCSYLFDRCTSLTTLPSTYTLTAIKTASNVFEYMFNYCYSLTNVNNLTIEDDSTSGTAGSYQWRYMFSHCESLANVSNLTISTSAVQAGYCCASMFNACLALVTPPTLPSVTTVPNHGYESMFSGCTSLTTAPVLSSATVNTYGYSYMFDGCTALTTVPKLPATTLNTYCYQYMFRGCTNLTSINALPALTLKNYCYYYMYQNCTKIKLSTTKTGDYQTTYRIPTSGTGTTATSALGYMFTGTGGTFTGTPTINTNYYTSNTIVS